MDLLRERGVEFDTIEYLVDPLDAKGLAKVLDALSGPHGALVRKDKSFAALGLDPERYGESASRSDVIELLQAHPELMQRPIALLENRAVIGRPSDRVLELIED